MPPLILVDDDPLIRELLADVLAGAGSRARCAEDGQVALDRVGNELPDLVVSTVAMPRVDGPELVRRLRDRGAAVPVILISAHHHRPAVPGVRFVPKPFDGDRLAREVGAALAGAVA